MNNIDNNYRDYINSLKSISILDVCQYLGIDVNKKGNRHWCKLRPENEASVLLNTDKVPNSFHDYGGAGLHGDVIQLVCTVKNVDFNEATKLLGDAFGIHMNRSQETNNELSQYEYSKLNLYGQRASMNFSFNALNQSDERIAQLSEKYSIPMNELRKKHSKIYEKLIYDKAIPLVQELRNNYYHAVFAEYYLLKSLNAEELFCQTPESKMEFASQIDELKEAERILRKATQRTSIKAYPIGEYDPHKDLEKIKNGEIKVHIGNLNYVEMKDTATERDTVVRYQKLSWDDFYSLKLEDYPHSAFIQGDKVTLGYLESDREALKTMFNAAKSGLNKDSLNTKISDAENKQKEQPRENFNEQAHCAER